jgi:hypothetical protein
MSAMIAPPSSRNRLDWAVFEQIGSSRWALRLLPYYAYLFDDREPGVSKKSVGGWQDSKSGRTKVRYFVDLSESDRLRINEFISDYKQFVVLGLNRSINEHFSDELVSCVACDFIADSPEQLYKDIRTPTGHLFHQYKYERNRGVLDCIADVMIHCLWRLPYLDRTQKHSLSFIPPRPNKGIDLPRDLVETMAGRLSESRLLPEADSILYPSLVIDKPEFKDLTWDRKHEVWRRIYSCGAVSMSGSVKGKRLIVIDDLYQSGNTIWSYAGYLKELGSAAVHGLVYVKTLRDTDNQ